MDLVKLIESTKFYQHYLINFVLSNWSNHLCLPFVCQMLTLILPYSLGLGWPHLSYSSPWDGSHEETRAMIFSILFRLSFLAQLQVWLLEKVVTCSPLFLVQFTFTLYRVVFRVSELLSPLKAFSYDVSPSLEPHSDWIEPLECL